MIRMRDCSMALHNVFSERSETVSAFNAVQAIWDIAKGKNRKDLSPAFYAEMINWVKGLKGRAGFQFLFKHKENDLLSGREKAVIRSAELDQIAAMVEERMDSYANGLRETAVQLRLKQRDRILEKLGADETDWGNWKWHLKNVISDADSVPQFDGDRCQTARFNYEGKGRKASFWHHALLSFAYGRGARCQ